MKKHSRAVLAAAALLVAGGASAQTYVGLAAGATNADIDCTGTTRCDNKDTGFKVFGGYRFTPNIAGELSYFNFGKATASVVVPPFGLVDGEFKTGGFGVGVAFSGAFAPGWSGVARVGIASLESKISVAASGVSGAESDTQAAAYFGLGLGYALTKSLSLDLAADFSKGEFDGEKADVRLISVGLTYAF